MIAPGKIYFISEHSSQEFFHGGIGPADIEKILLRNGAISISFPYHFEFSPKAKMARMGYLVKMCLTISPGSVIVFQHPLYARMHKLLLQMMRRRKSVKLVCLVADIDGIKDGNENFLKKEIHFLSAFKYFIVHNSKMYAWLQSFHPSAVCTLLQCFDFLTKPATHKRVLTNNIVFAGNLQKSRFLELLHIWLQKHPTLHVNLYGPGITKDMLISKNVTFKGVHPPYVLPDFIEGSFGLIWDGNGIEKPSGSLGNYMQYISHHKLSLYIVCNLPIIVHEDTGSAEFVKKFNIGFTVKSLFEIEDKINALSETDYQSMVQNTYKLSIDITEGNGLQNALTAVLLK